MLDAHGASVLGAVAKMSDVMFPEGPVAIVQKVGTAFRLYDLVES